MARHVAVDQVGVSAAALDVTRTTALLSARIAGPPAAGDLVFFDGLGPWCISSAAKSSVQTATQADVVNTPLNEGLYSSTTVGARRILSPT